MCCTQLAGNSGCKISPKFAILGTIAQLCRAISSQLRNVLTIGKKLVKHQYLPIWPHNMVNFGPLTAEICWRVCGTPANFNGFRVLASLLQAAATSLNGNEPNFTRCLAASWTGTLYIVHIHRVRKKWDHYFCLWLCQMLANFQNSFTGRLSSKFLAMLLWNIPPHLKRVATLPCEILMSEKQRTWSISCDSWYFARYYSSGI